MKKFTFLASILCLSIIAKAQDEDLKPFKVDVSIGYAIPSGSGTKGGILFVTEPKYAVIPEVSVGLRMEAAIVARIGSFVNGVAQAADVKASGSYLLTGDYYFSNKYALRPFAGAGLGIFSFASATGTASGSGASGEGSKFGGMIRGGIEAKHFRFGLEYNIVPSIDLNGTDSQGRATTEKSKNSYVGIKIGVLLGGGPR